MTSSSSKLLQIQGKWQQERSPTKKAKPYQKKSSSPWHCPKKLDKTTQNPADYHHFFGPRFNNLLRVVLETRIHTQPWFRILWIKAQGRASIAEHWPLNTKDMYSNHSKKTGKPGQEPPRYSLRSKAQRMWPCRSPKDNPLKAQARTWGDLAGLGALWHECCTKEALAPDASRLQTCHPTCAHGSLICLAQRTRPARARWFKTA